MPGSVITGIWKPTTCGTTGIELMKDHIAQMISQLHKGQQITVVFDCSFAEERLRQGKLKICACDLIKLQNPIRGG